MNRESVYVCRFASHEGPLVTRVLAWSEQDAEQVLRTELAAEDIQAGPIEVVAGEGHLEDEPQLHEG